MHWPQRPENVETFSRFLQQGKRFGFAKVDSEVPREMWEKFEETPPLFYKGKTMHDQRKLVGALSVQKVVLYVPLLKWYLKHGLKNTAVHRTIDYVALKVSSVSSKKSQKTGARVPKKASCPCWQGVFKLFGNSAYGKIMEALKTQSTVKEKME